MRDNKGNECLEEFEISEWNKHLRLSISFFDINLLEQDFFCFSKELCFTYTYIHIYKYSSL